MEVNGVAMGGMELVVVIVRHVGVGCVYACVYEVGCVYFFCVHLLCTRLCITTASPHITTPSSSSSFSSFFPSFSSSSSPPPPPHNH